MWEVNRVNRTVKIVYETSPSDSIGLEIQLFLNIALIINLIKFQW